MVRAGEKKDFDTIVKMAKEFTDLSGYNEKYCPNTVYAMASMCLDQGLLSVLEIDGIVKGVACGLKGALVTNSEVSMGSELIWWVDPEFRKGKNGISLLRHLENQAKKEGMKYWNMVFLESSMPLVIEKIYQKMGYNKTEVTYTKVL